MLAEHLLHATHQTKRMLLSQFLVVVSCKHGHGTSRPSGQSFQRHNLLILQLRQRKSVNSRKVKSMLGKWITSRFRITGGIVIIVVTVLGAAWQIGLIPNRTRDAQLEQAKTAEILGTAAGHFLKPDDSESLTRIITSFVEHDEALRSAGLRNLRGQLIASAGQHERIWKPVNADDGSGTQVTFPLFRGEEHLANVEVVLTPVSLPGWSGFWAHPWVQLSLFSGACCFLGFAFFFGIRFNPIDPSLRAHTVQEALDHLNEGLLLVNSKGRIVIANTAFASLVNVPVTKLSGRKVNRFSWQNEQHRPLTDYPWTQSVSQNQTIINAILRLDVRNDTATFKVNCTPFQRGSKTLGAMICFEDITAAAPNQTAVQETSQAAATTNRARSQFLSKKSCELQAPVNATLAFNELLQREMDPTEQAREDYLSAVRASGSQLLERLNSILDLSKIESGKLGLEILPCSPFQLVQDVVDILGVRAAEKGISLTCEFRSALPNFIQTDPVRFQQILTNLVGNAIKFTATGGVRISTNLVRSHAQWQLAIDVVDTGIGMSKPRLTAVGESLQATQRTVNQRFPESGLGLPVSQRMIQLLGGDLQVRSIEGQGTIISYCIQVGDVEEQPKISQQDYVDSIRDHRPTLTEMPAARFSLPDLKETETPRPMESAFDVNGLEQFQQIYAIAFEAIESAMGRTDFLAVAELSEELQHVVAVFDIAPLQEVLHQLTLAAKSYDAEQIHTAMTTLQNKMDAAQAASTVEFSQPGTHTSPQSGLRKTLRPSTKPVPSSAGDAHSGPCIRSTLPTDVPEFRSIVREFVDKLEAKITQLVEAEKNNDWDEVKSIAYWIKGAGGTVGFADLFEPAKNLEQAAMDQRPSDISDFIQQLDSIYCRIDASDPPPTETTS